MPQAGGSKPSFSAPTPPKSTATAASPPLACCCKLPPAAGSPPQELWVVGLCQPHIQAGLAVGAKVALVMPDPSLHIDCTLCAESPLPRYANWMALAHALAPD